MPNLNNICSAVAALERATDVIMEPRKDAQGSILGPILFTIFINDLPDYVEGTCKINADDTELYGKAARGDVLQRDLVRLQEWSQMWDLSFNIAKCKVMHIDSKLSFDSHIQKIVSKAKG